MGCHANPASSEKQPLKRARWCSRSHASATTSTIILEIKDPTNSIFMNKW